MAQREKKKKRIETGIYKLADGRYWVEATARDPYTGRMRGKTSTLDHGQTIREARQHREHLKSQIADTRKISSPNVRTVLDYAEWWLRSKGHKLKPSSLRDYADALERLCDVIGGLWIRDVVRADVQRVVHTWEALEKDVVPNRWLSAGPKKTSSEARQRVLELLGRNEVELRDVLGQVKTTRRTLERMIAAGQLLERVEELPPEPYATDTLRGWWRRCCVMLRDACADGLLDADPTFRVRPPETKLRGVMERDTLSARELGEFLEAVQSVAPQRYAEVITLAYTGMRPGEMYALTWEDIDWAGKRIAINKAISKRRRTDRTKTNAPREAPLVDVVADELRKHHADLLTRGKLEELVFPASRPGKADAEKKPRAADSLARPLALASSRADLTLKVTPQVLRRTFDTLLVTAGVDRIVLRSMIGHTTEKMTERYAGVRLEDKHDAVLRIVDGPEEP